MTTSSLATDPVDPVAAASPVAPTPTQRRWQIIALQMRAGSEPCFGTEKRHYCGERTRCEFRVECLALRASWRS